MTPTLPHRSKVLWIKDAFLEQVLSGHKTVETRVAYPNIARLQPGDMLLLNEQHPFRIVAVRRYASFDELVAAENPATIAPELADPAALLVACRALYPPDKEQLGVVALEIQPETRIHRPVPPSGDVPTAAHAGTTAASHDHIPEAGHGVSAGFGPGNVLAESTDCR